MELTQKRRLSTDARREQLLASGARLLATRPFDEVSIEEIARAAGVSKGLLYHYFPTKKDFLIAALERGQDELAALTAPDPDLPPAEQLAASLDRFLDFVEEHEAAYAAIFRSRGGGDPEIQAALEAGRQQRMDAVIESLASLGGSRRPASSAPPPWRPPSRAGSSSSKGRCCAGSSSRDLGRDELRELLGLALIGSLQAAEAVGSSG